jgi:predicted  nucleic acid-binding Zn-ribbon protein
MKFILTQLCLVAGLKLTVRTGSPVEKVVELIEELKAKILADGANEQKLYDKFACWCETTTARKADAIDDGKALIGKTTTTILTLKGAIAVLASEIAELQAQIAEAQEAMAKATKIREKENSDYQQEKAYMETTLTSLHAAIEVLGGAGTKKMMLLKAASMVRSAILGSPKLDGLTPDKLRLMKSFFEDPVSLMQEPVDYYDQKAQAKASYSPQSATIMGILKDMYDTFSADLEKSNQEESDKQKGFEDLIAEKEKQVADWSAEVTDKEGQKAEKSTMLSEAEELLSATTAQLKVDEDFFATARDSCKAKSDEWDERSRLRTEQLDGIEKALEILTSDEARKTFAASTSVRAQDTFGTEGSREMDSTEVTKMSVGDVLFLQMEMPREKAYRALKKIIGHSKNLRLARIAVAVRTATQGHFDEVIAEIDRMIELLGEEGQEDIEQRDWCIAEQNNQTNHKENLEYDISQLQAKITAAEKKKAELEAEKEDTLKKKADLEEAMEQALADREAENQAFTTAKQDDLNAIELLGQAIEALSAYGSNNALLLQQPAMEVSEDQAPDATFSAKDSHKGASDGIVALLTQIKENLEIEIGVSTKGEAAATEDYLKLKADADAQIKSYEEQIVALDAAIADTDAEITSLTETKEDTEGEHKTTVEYLAKIEPNCEWIKASFYKRAELRTKEADGLREAKAILAGAEGGEFGFMQSVH